MNDVFKDYRNTGGEGKLVYSLLPQVLFLFQTRSLEMQFYTYLIIWIIFIVRLHTFLIGLAKAVAPSFKDLPPILSIPSDFAGFISSMSFRTTL